MYLYNSQHEYIVGTKQQSCENRLIFLMKIMQNVTVLHTSYLLICNSDDYFLSVEMV